MKKLISIQEAMIKEGMTLALAESCTGGAIASSITKIPDSSKYFLGAFIAYSDAFKEHFLGVSPSLLKKEGAVSRACALAMAEGLLARTKADYVLATTGFMGPTGGTPSHPVGTVFVAWGKRGETPAVEKIQSSFEREKAIQWSVDFCLNALWEKLQEGLS